MSIGIDVATPLNKPTSPRETRNDADGDSHLIDCELVWQRLNHETLRAERTRVLILTAVFAMAAVGFLVLPPILTPESLIPFQGGLARAYVVLLLAVTALYAGVMLFALRRLQPDSRFAFHGLRYGSALAETGLVSLMIALSSQSFGPACAMLTPLPFLYLVVIVAVALRLEVGQCIFTGVVAAGQYTALGAYFVYLDRFSGKEPILLDPVHHIQKGVLLLLCGLVAAFVARKIRSSVLNSLEAMEARSRVTGIFGQYVSDPIVDKLLKEPVESISESRRVCIMFLDIRDFTSFSEKTAPEQVIDYLNRLFPTIIDIVGRHNGVINKFLGDGFMAIFGAPIATGNETEEALIAAQEILDEIDRINQSRELPPTRIGIGLHAGRAIVGTVGSKRRKEFTVIGDVVNLAARIEALNKQFGSRLLVSEPVWDVWKGWSSEGTPLGAVDVKGLKTATSVYRLA